MVETGKGWNKGGTKRTMAVADSILGAGKLALEVQQEAGSGGFHHYHGKYKGIRLFVPLHQSNNNMLHTNLNYKIVKNITNSTYVMNVLHDTTKFRYNENAPRKNLQKTSKI